jgi:hypothetical protein
MSNMIKCISVAKSGGDSYLTCLKSQNEKWKRTMYMTPKTFSRRECMNKGISINYKSFNLGCQFFELIPQHR